MVATLFRIAIVSSQYLPHEASAMKPSWSARRLMLLHSLVPEGIAVERAPPDRLLRTTLTHCSNIQICPKKIFFFIAPLVADP